MRYFECPVLYVVFSQLDPSIKPLQLNPKLIFSRNIKRNDVALPFLSNHAPIKYLKKTKKKSILGFFKLPQNDYLLCMVDFLVAALSAPEMREMVTGRDLAACLRKIPNFLLTFYFIILLKI